MKNILMGLLMAAGVFSANAYAADDHLHAGDIEIEVEDGQLGTHGAAHAQLGTGYAIFEGDFRDLPGGPYKTKTPGFDSHEGTFDDGDIIGYKAIGSLWFWSGTNWTNSVSNGETVKLEGSLFENTSWGATGVSGDVIGALGQADSTGKIHEHLDFSLSAAGTPTIGAYYITLQLLSADVNSTFDGIVQNSKYEISNPFYLVFNNGLNAASFEASVDALHVAAVPEPSTYGLLLVGLVLMGWQIRRKA